MRRGPQTADKKEPRGPVVGGGGALHKVFLLLRRVGGERIRERITPRVLLPHQFISTVMLPHQ